MRNTLIALAILLTGCASAPPPASVRQPDPVHQAANLRTIREERKPLAAGERNEVAEGLASSDRQVQYLAFQAAPKAVNDPAVRGELLRLAGSEQPYQAIPALEILSEPERFTLDDGVAGAFFRALEHTNPAVIVRAIDRMGIEAESLGARPGFYERVVGLIGHESPYVRGQAIELSTRMVAPVDEKSLMALLRTRLSDAHPYVRSKAAAGLGEMGDKAAVRALSRLLSDHATNEVATSYLDLLGETVPLEDSGSPLGRVDDAALSALDMLDVFDYGEIDPEHKGRDIAREAKRAQAALAKN